MTPGCWERNTAKYGLRELPLCTACAAALAGKVYQRPWAETRPGNRPHGRLTSEASRGSTAARHH